MGVIRTSRAGRQPSPQTSNRWLGCLQWGSPPGHDRVLHWDSSPTSHQGRHREPRVPNGKRGGDAPYRWLPLGLFLSGGLTEVLATRETDRAQPAIWK
jgi:hypothetical protein